MCFYYDCLLRKLFERIAVCEYNNKNTNARVNSFKNIKAKQALDINGYAPHVKDQFVASIKIDINSSQFNIRYEEEAIYKKKNDRVKVNEFLLKKSYPTIVLIVESPHYKEFLKGNYYPAMGRTGINIEKYFICNLVKYISQGTNNILGNGEYKLKIVEPIQYQCSLGVDTSKYRTSIFKNCWNYNCFKKDFIKRLKRDNPVLLINCCTGQYKGEIHGLQQLVQDEIDKYFQDKTRIYGYHPSSIHFLKGFKDCP